MAKKKPKPQGPRRGYDVEMIRDFLNHLEWEARVCHAETTHLKDKLNPELCDALRPYLTKYGSPLLETNDIDMEGSTEGDAMKAVEQFRAHQAERMKRYLAALRTLRPLFKESLSVAKTGTMVIRKWTVQQVLDEFGEGNQPADDDNDDETN